MEAEEMSLNRDGLDPYRQVLGRYRYEFKRDGYNVEPGDYGWY